MINVKMPFTSASASEAGKKSGKKRTEWASFGIYLTQKGTVEAMDIIQRLMRGEKVNRNQIQGLNHFKDLLEYFKPKLTRTELKQTGNNQLIIIDKMVQNINNATSESKNKTIIDVQSQDSISENGLDKPNE